MAQGKKLQNSFNTFLPQNFREFKMKMPTLTSNEGVVASLLRICCEEDDVKAIKIAFERILGKPEKVVIIKRTLVRVVYTEAIARRINPTVDNRVQDEVAVVPITDDKVVIDAVDAPAFLLRKQLDAMGEMDNAQAFEIIDKKDRYTVVEVLVANLYAIALRGSNLAAINMLFDYLDGTVADVIRVEGENTVMLESYATIAPYEAKKGDDGVWYVETEAVG